MRSFTKQQALRFFAMILLLNSVACVSHARPEKKASVNCEEKVRARIYEEAKKQGSSEDFGFDLQIIPFADPAKKDFVLYASGSFMFSEGYVEDSGAKVVVKTEGGKSCEITDKVIVWIKN